MRYKYVLWVLIILITVYSASAVILNNGEAYYSFDNSSITGNNVTDLSGNNHWATNTGTVWDTGILNESRFYNGNNHIDVHDPWFDGTGDWSVSLWLNYTNTGFEVPLDKSGGVGQQNIKLITNMDENNAADIGNIQLNTNDGAGHKLALVNNPNLNNGSWNHLVFVYDDTGNTCEIWINGINRTVAGTVAGGDLADANPPRFGETLTGTYDYHGNLDEFGFYKRKLNTSEISALWNSGSGFNPYAIPPLNKSITVNYTTPIYEERLTQHSILFSKYNITNLTTANLTYNGSIYNGVINWSNSSYVDFTVNLTTPFVYLNNTAIPFNWTYHLRYVNGTNVSNTTINYNQYVLWNLTKYPRVNITAFTIGGAGINNFSLSNIERNINTTTGSIYFWTNATKILNISIDASGYALDWALINFTNGSFGSYNFSLYTTNSILFNFRDEETGNLINNVSIELISDVYSNNYSTTNGTLYVDLLSPTIYAMRYIATDGGYFERFYYFNLQNRTFTNLTLYLLSNSTGTEVRATVYDESNFLVENAYIKVLRYDLATNSYLLMEIAKTNFEGETQLHLILNDEFYQFILEYPFGTVSKITSPTYIYETSLTFQIIIRSQVGERFYKSQNITYDLSFNNATNNFKFIYSDANNIVSKGCLKIWKIDALHKTLYNSSCVNSPSATILLPVANTTGTTYVAQAYVYFSEPEYFLTGLSHTFDTVAIAGLYGIFLILILTITFIMVGYWSKSLALILAPLPMMMGSVLNIINISIGMCIGIEIICVIVAYWISRRN